MISRVIKNLIRAGFRATQDVEGLPTEEPYRRFAIEHLNLLLGQSPDDSAVRRYWDEVKTLLVIKFSKNALESYERKPEFDLFERCDLVRVLLRLEQLTGIHLTPAAKMSLRREPRNFIVVDSDIQEIVSRVKSMNVVEMSSAIALSMQADAIDGKASERLFELSFRKFEDAVNASPSNVTTFRYWGSALFSQALKLDANGEKERARNLLTQANAKYNAIAVENRTHRSSLVVHANISRHLALRALDPSLAALLFCRALQFAAAAGDLELISTCGQNVLDFSRSLDISVDSRNLLMPIRVALGHIGGWAVQGPSQVVGIEPGFGESQESIVIETLRCVFNLVCVEIFNSSKSLDMDVCEDLAHRLRSDNDGVALFNLAEAARDKFLSWRPEGITIPLRLLAVFESALQLLQQGESPKQLMSALHQSGSLAVLIAWTHIAHIVELREPVAKGIESLLQCGASTALLSNAIKLVMTFYEVSFRSSILFPSSPSFSPISCRAICFWKTQCNNSGSHVVWQSFGPTNTVGVSVGIPSSQSGCSLQSLKPSWR